MARFIPRIEREEIQHQSEQLVFDALSRLPDDYVVLHSYPWLRQERDLATAPLVEGEADFIILHPRRGLLVVEVKGGEPVLRSRVWYRGAKEMKDPFQQARRSRYVLLEAIKDRTRGRVTKEQIAHGDLVIFPNATYSGALPLDADAATLIDAPGLSDIQARVERAFAAWTRHPVSLTPELFGELIEALLPKLRLVRCVGPDIASERARIVQLTENQQATLRGLLGSKRVLVDGVAGSGKTLLALQFALSLAREAKRVLFLCFNRHLAIWLQEQLALEQRRDPAVSNIDLSTFHTAAFRLAKRAGVEFAVPQDAPEAFWDIEAPMILEQAIDALKARGEPVEYDAVVVDEGQDFCRDWWVTVQSLSKCAASGALYVFMDRQQSLRGEDRPPPIELPVRFPLSLNCRNTRAIAISAGRVAKASIESLPGMPQGQVPGVRRAPSASAEAGLVMDEVRRLRAGGVEPSQIAILGPATKDRGGLSRISNIDGVPLTSDAAQWRSGQGILVSTARAFKGLEADVVILYDLASLGPGFTRTDLYVAWTRAKHRLTLVSHGPEVRAELEAALADAEREMQSSRAPGSEPAAWSL